MSILNTEPVAIAAAVRALLAVLVAFGAGLTGAQVAAVVVAVEVVGALFVRAKVTPEGNVQEFDSVEEVFAALTEGVEFEINWDDES